MRDIPFGRPILGQREQDAVAEVLKNPILVHGPKGESFEHEFANWTGAPHAVAVSSCTAAMHLTWMARGLGPGDEVIVPALTHTATAHAVEQVGARPVFADVDPESGNISPSAVAEAISDRTRAIAVVHYAGEPVDLPAISRLAEAHDLFLLEDCALAIGSRVDGVHVGLHGDVGCFSFYPVKHMTTAEGGMAICRDPELAASLRSKRAFGYAAGSGPGGLYDVDDLGLNYRLNELQAALGLVQLEQLDGFLAARRRNYRILRDGLAGCAGIQVLAASEGEERQSSYYCGVGLLSGDLATQRDAVRRALAERGVGTSVYYPGPLPLLSYYREKYGHDRSMFPEAVRFAESSIALPVGPHLSVDDMEYVVSTIQAVTESGAR